MIAFLFPFSLFLIHVYIPYIDCKIVIILLMLLKLRQLFHRHSLFDEILSIEYHMQILN